MKMETNFKHESWQIEQETENLQENDFNMTAPSTGSTKVNATEKDAEGYTRELTIIQKTAKDVAKYTKTKVSSLCKMILSGEDEFRCLKAIIRIVSALLTSGFLYVLLHYSFGFTLATAGKIMAGIFLFLLIGFTFKLIRCVILIMIPSLCTKQGRALFLSLITGLLIAGPVVNITDNTLEIVTTMGCTADLVYDQLKALKRQLEEPLRELAEKLKAYMKGLQLIIENLVASALEPFKEAIRTLKSAIQSVLDTLAELSAECSKWLLEAQESCTKTMNTAKLACQMFIEEMEKQSLGTLDDMGEWFDDNFKRKRRELSFLIRERHREKRDECNGLSSGVCNVISSLDVACNPVEWLENQLEPVAEAIEGLLQSVEDFFAFEVSADVDISGDISVSKNASTVLSEVTAEVLSKTRVIIQFVTSVSNLVALSLIFLFLKSLNYIKNYRLKDHYDNIFITKAFVAFDDECKERNEEAVMPLQSHELKLYVVTYNPLLSEAERKTIKYELKLLGYHFLFGTLVMAFDYILYYSLNLISDYGGVALNVEGVNTIDVDVEGEGVFGVIIHAMVDTLTLNSTYSIEFNFTSCLPDPSEPNLWFIPSVAGLYAMAVCIVIMQGYGLRLRNKIVSSFYPEQDAARIHYLHQKILHERLNILSWLKDLILCRRKEGQVRERLRFRNLIGYLCPRFAKYCDVCMPAKRACLSCDRPARVGMIFHKCKTPKCNALYCESCFEVTKQICLVCEAKNEVGMV